MKIFVATSFSTRVNTRGKLDPKLKKEIEIVLVRLRNAGHEVSCAVETDGWRINSDDAAGSVKKDLAAIDAADTLMALLDDDVSTGVQFEIGYAAKAGKRVMLVQKPGTTMRWFNAALVEAGMAERLDSVKSPNL